MKRAQLILIVSGLFFSTEILAQFTLGLRHEAYLPMLEREVGDGNIVNLSPDNRQLLVSSATLSYGAGRSYGIVAEWQLNKHLLIGTDFLLFKGKAYQKTVSFSFRTTTWLYQAENIRLSPYVQHLIPLREDLSIWTSIGFIWSFNNELLINRHEVSANPAIGDDIFNTGFTERSSFGLSLGGGLRFKLSNRTTLQLGVRAVMQNAWPDQREITAYVRNDDNVLPTLPTSSRLTNYVDKLIADANASINENQPSQTLRSSFPLSGIGGTISIHYCLSSKNATQVLPIEKE